MWTTATIEKIFSPRTGNSRNSGEPYTAVDLDLAFQDYDFNGQPIVDQNHEPILSHVRVTALNDLTRPLTDGTMKAGDQVNVELHFYTKLIETSSGGAFRSNNISLISLQSILQQ